MRSMKIAITLLILIAIGTIVLFKPEPSKVVGCDGKWVEVTRSVVIDAKGATLEYMERVCQKEKS